MHLVTLRVRICGGLIATPQKDREIKPYQNRDKSLENIGRYRKTQENTGKPS
jgi:hypothetical protein